MRGYPKNMPTTSQMHGMRVVPRVIATQGQSKFLGTPNPANFELGNPLSASGKKVMTSMKKEYGEEKGKQVFYATLNKEKKGTSKWHKKK